MESSNSINNNNSKNSSNKNNEGSGSISQKLVNTVKTSFIIATLCIACLTLIASYILLSNYHSQNTANNLINNAVTSCKVDSLKNEPVNAMNNIVDSTSNAVIKVNEPHSSAIESTLSDPAYSLDSIVYNLTLAVNSINNVLTSGSIFIAILTLFIGLVGLFGYHSLKSDIKEDLNKTMSETSDKVAGLKKDLNEKINKAEKRIDHIRDIIDECCNDSKEQILNLNKELLTLKDTINSDIQDKLSGFNEQITDFNGQVELIKSSIIQQVRYFDQSIKYLYQATYSNIEQMDDQTQAQQRLENLFHELQIAKLYRTSINADEDSDVNHNRITALEYLEENGTMEDIPHLDYIARYDPNEHVKTRAIEVRAIIRNRFNNNQSDTNPPVVS